VLDRARREIIPYRRWLPWLCCFTGCRLDEPADAMVRDIEKVGPHWVLNGRVGAWAVHRHGELLLGMILVAAAFKAFWRRA
jgi:hypothetical protein